MDAPQLIKKNPYIRVWLVVQIALNLNHFLVLTSVINIVPRGVLAGTETFLTWEGASPK